jgi:serine/threonine protein kinase
MGACLSQDLVERYVGGNCSGQEERIVETHSTQCEECRRRIESERSDTPAQEEPDSVKPNVHARVTATVESAVCRDDNPTKSMTEDSTDRLVQRAFGEGVDTAFEGYKVLGQIGEGGAGTVWRALQLSTQRQVALKVLGMGTFASEKARLRFEREVELTARLEHPNIARIYDSGLHRGVYYYAMELFEGQHLDKYIQGRELSTRQILKLVHIVCQAVQYAHQRGVIHRDLKPSNIIVTDDGQPHILDFGLAKTYLEDDKTVTVSLEGDVAGTPAFMSPEQAAGHLDEIDTRTDVYSLGVILFNVLTNEWPYDLSGSRFEVLRNIQEQEPVRPSKITPRFDADIEAILLKALAKDSSERYQSATELAHDVQCWLEGLPIVARSVNSLYLLRKIITRHRYTSTIVALLLIIVLSFCCIYVYLYSGLRKSNVKLEKTVKSLNEKRGDYEALAQQVTFTHLLNTWREGHRVETHRVARYFSRGTREAQACDFLSDPRPLEEKAAGFWQNMKEREPFFAKLVIAEHFLRNGSQEEALEAYQECMTHVTDSGKDQLLKMRVGLRLYELTREDPQGKTPDTDKD